MTVTSNIHTGLTAWASATFTVGQRCSNASNAYQCTTGGSSTAAPTGTGATINNGGTAVFKWLSTIDYTTLQAWWNALPSTLTQAVTALIWNDGPITCTISTPWFTSFASAKTLAGFAVLITPAPGEGIRDYFAANPTAPRALNQTKGVCFVAPSSGTSTGDYFALSGSGITIDGLQFYSANLTGSGEWDLYLDTGDVMQNCIMDGSGSRGSSGGGLLITGGTGNVIRNCLFVDRDAAGDNGHTYYASSGGANLYNCTFVAVNGSSTGTAIDAYYSGAVSTENCIFMGYTAPFLINTTAVASSYSGLSNSSLPSGASGGTGNVYSITATNTFKNAYLDFSLKGGAPTIDLAHADTTNVPSADDLAKTTRPQGGGWDMGPFEYPVGATTNIHVGLTAWAAGQTIAIGARRSNAGNAYQATSAGTTAAAGPAHASGTVSDGGGVGWLWLSAVDFTLVQAWWTGQLATFTQNIVGHIWNDGTITTTLPTCFLDTNISVKTVGSYTTTLTPAPGEGYRDTLSNQTTALYFNAANGVSFTCPTSGTATQNWFNVSVPHFTLDGLQFLDPVGTSGAGDFAFQGGSSGGAVVRNCLIDGIAGAGAELIYMADGTGLVANTTIIDRQAAGNNAWAVSFVAAGSVVANSLVLSTNSNTTGVGINCTAASTVKNTMVLNYTTPIGDVGGTAASVATSYCLFQNASLPAASSNGGSNLFSKAATNQFVSTTADFRLKSTADAVDGGTADSTDIPTTDDVAKTARPQGLAWDIGPWEYKGGIVRAIAAAETASSTESATLSRSRKLGTWAASSTSAQAAALSSKRGQHAAETAAGALTAGLTRTRRLSSWTATGTSAEAAFLTSNHVLTWARSSVSSQSATLAHNPRPAVAAETASSTLTAAMRRSRALALLATGVSVQTATAIHQRFMGAALPATSAQTAILGRTRPAAATGSAASTQAGTIQRAHGMASAAAGSSALSATLSAIRSGAVAPLAAAGALSGRLTSNHLMAVTAAATGSLAARAASTHTLTVAETAGGALHASIARIHPGLTLLATASSALAASLGRTQPVSANGTAAGTLTGIASRPRAMAWTAAAVSAQAGGLIRPRPIASAAASGTILAATASRSRALACTATGASTEAATALRIHPSLQLPLTATGTLSAPLARSRPMIAGLSAGFTLASAAITLLRPMALTATASSSASNALLRNRPLASLPGSSSVLAAAAARLRLMASTASASTVQAGSMGRTRPGSAVAQASTSMLSGTLTTQRVQQIAAAQQATSVLAITGGRLAALYPGRITFVPSEASEAAGALQQPFDPMDPSDVDTFTFDWSARDIVDDPIVSATLIAVPPLLTITGVMFNGSLVQAVCSNGPASGGIVTIGLRCDVELTSGRSLHWTATLPVETL